MTAELVTLSLVVGVLWFLLGWYIPRTVRYISRALLQMQLERVEAAADLIPGSRQSRIYRSASFLLSEAIFIVDRCSWYESLRLFKTLAGPHADVPVAKEIRDEIARDRARYFSDVTGQEVEMIMVRVVVTIERSVAPLAFFGNGWMSLLSVTVYLPLILGVLVWEWVKEAVEPAEDPMEVPAAVIRFERRTGRGSSLEPPSQLPLAGVA